MPLILVDANRVIAGAFEKANVMDAKMNIAVCDARRTALGLSTRSGAMWASGFGNQGNAMTPPSDILVAI